jgi:hypothetical protein
MGWTGKILGQQKKRLKNTEVAESEHHQPAGSTTPRRNQKIATQVAAAKTRRPANAHGL